MSGVRWNHAEGVFEGRCDACCEWLPLAPDVRHDVWPVKGRGLRICRACDNLRTKGRTVERRRDPAYRAAERLQQRAYVDSLSPAERRALYRSRTVDLDRRRVYQREYMRRYRERVALAREKAA